MSQQGKTNAFHEYKRFEEQINEHMFREHGFRYLSPEQTNGQWRTKIPYTPEIEAEVIKFTTDYINMGISHSQHAKLRSFVTKLVGLMAGYISKYIAKNPEYKCRDQARQAVTEILTKKSRTLNPPVLDAEAKRKRTRIIAAQAECKHRQIKNMFERATHLTADYSK